jgi:hypothetical protein
MSAAEIPEKIDHSDEIDVCGAGRIKLDRDDWRGLNPTVTTKGLPDFPAPSTSCLQDSFRHEGIAAFNGTATD